MLARKRFEGVKNIQIKEGDIRESGFLAKVEADIVISQRVIINLLDKRDQKQALNNLVKLLKRPNWRMGGGWLCLLESFIAPLINLNKAREEFNLDPIRPAYHNLYLEEDIFYDLPIRQCTEIDIPPSNFLSVHYYISRVLHAFLCRYNKINYKRNSEFVKFLTFALRENIGDYSPLKFYVFERY